MQRQTLFVESLQVNVLLAMVEPPERQRLRQSRVSLLCIHAGGFLCPRGDLALLHPMTLQRPRLFKAIVRCPSLG